MAAVAMNVSVLIPVGGTVYLDDYRHRAFNWLCHRYEVLLPEAEVILGTSSHAVFNRAEARNNAFEIATGDVVVVADADTVFHKDQLQAAVNLVGSGTVPWVVPYAEERYYNLSQLETDLVLSTLPDATIPEPSHPSQWEHRITSWAGLLVLSRAAWEKVGGYDERFRGWGYEDNAFRAALDWHVGPHRRLDHYCLHLWHPVSDDQTFGQPNIAANRELFRRYEAGELP